MRFLFFFFAHEAIDAGRRDASLPPLSLPQTFFFFAGGAKISLFSLFVCFLFLQSSPYPRLLAVAIPFVFRTLFPPPSCRRAPRFSKEPAHDCKERGIFRQLCSPSSRFWIRYLALLSHLQLEVVRVSAPPVAAGDLSPRFRVGVYVPRGALPPNFSVARVFFFTFFSFTLREKSTALLFPQGFFDGAFPYLTRPRGDLQVFFPLIFCLRPPFFSPPVCVFSLTLISSATDSTNPTSQEFPPPLDLRDPYKCATAFCGGAGLMPSWYSLSLRRKVLN